PLRGSVVRTGRRQDAAHAPCPSARAADRGGDRLKARSNSRSERSGKVGADKHFHQALCQFWTSGTMYRKDFTRSMLPELRGAKRAIVRESVRERAERLAHRAVHAGAHRNLRRRRSRHHQRTSAPKNTRAPRVRITERWIAIEVGSICMPRAWTMTRPR